MGVGGALREMARARTTRVIVRSEFSPRRLSVLRALYRFYLHRCLPVLALSHQQKRLRIGESIEEFPIGETMLQLIEASGFLNANANAHWRIVTICGRIVAALCERESYDATDRRHGLRLRCAQ
jgi:ubiquinone/menaquinone biosynthesis C-methylase UbiE